MGMSDINELFDKARALCEQKRYAPAYELYGHACNVQPDSAIAWCNRGGVAFLMNRHAEAETHYHRARELDPTLEEAVYGLIRLHLARREWTEARDLLNEHRPPKDRVPQAEWQYLMGVACEKLGENEAAMAAYHAAVTRRHAPAQRVLLRLLLQRKQFTEALDLCFAMLPDAKKRWRIVHTCLRASEGDASVYDRAAQLYLASLQWAYAARVAAHAHRVFPDIDRSAYPALKESTWF